MNDNLFNIRQLPASVWNNILNLVVNRIGTDQHAFMITKDIIGAVSPGKTYRLANIFNDDATLQSKKDGSFAVFTEVTDRVDSDITKTSNANTNISNDIPVKHCCITGDWNITEDLAKNDANILGGMGSFIVDAAGEIDIPVVTATNELLAFYGSRLVNPEECIQFESEEELPLTVVDVGETYVKNYLMVPGLGEGAYVEYHNQPHFWLPLSDKCNGHVLLGRKLEDKYYFTGFKIPYGFGLYASPFVIHADPFLIGEHIVVYTVASEYSTVILKDKASHLLNLKFHTQAD